MGFKLPRQIFKEDYTEMIERTIEKQNLHVRRASPTKLLELKKVSEIIRKTGIPKQFIKKKLPQNLGHGLFLRPDAEPILRGTLIAPYTGFVYLSPEDTEDDSSYTFSLLDGIRLTKEEHALFGCKEKYNARRPYLLNLDAESQGNFTRYINHSSEPNIDAELFRVGKNALSVPTSAIEVYYLAKKKILPGEQLLVSYESDPGSYWGVMKIKPIPITPQTFRLKSDLTFQ